MKKISGVIAFLFLTSSVAMAAQSINCKRDFRSAFRSFDCRAQLVEGKCAASVEAVDNWILKQITSRPECVKLYNACVKSRAVVVEDSAVKENPVDLLKRKLKETRTCIINTSN
jgi:hypothetical protein